MDASDGIDYVQKSEYDIVKQERDELQSRIFNVTGNERTLLNLLKNKDEIISAKNYTIGDLREKNSILEIKIKELEKNNKTKNKNRVDPYIKLQEYNANVNKVFRIEYRKYFNKKRGDYIPNIDDFINDPPTDQYDPEYAFWDDFLIMYPNSDNPDFRNIYRIINNKRTLNGEYYDISIMDTVEFDNLMKLVFNDYETNIQLYENYRNWLFLFTTT